MYSTPAAGMPHSCKAFRRSSSVYGFTDPRRQFSIHCFSFCFQIEIGASVTGSSILNFISPFGVPFEVCLGELDAGVCDLLFLWFSRLYESHDFARRSSGIAAPSRDCAAI
jgi:hypothetical protein